MDEKSLRILEYHKIKQMLSEMCVSETGREKVKAMLPFSELSQVKTALMQTQQAEEVLFQRGSSPVEPFDDVRAQAARAALGSVLSMADLLRVARFMKCVRRVCRALDREEEPLPDSVFSVAALLTPTREQEEEIFRCIVSEDEMADTASSELALLRRKIRSGHEKIKEKLNSYIRKPELAKLLQDPIITVRGDRYVIPVKSENRAGVPGIVHDQSSSGATVFIEPMAVVEINNELRLLAAKEKEEIERILAALSAEVQALSEIIMQNGAYMAELDFIFAKAKLSREMRAVMPVMNDKGYLHIKRGRHPLIPSAKVVPLDVWLGDRFTVLLITGPNTGGKTVTLKTIGLFSLMAQSGLQVPADEGTELTVFDSIFADIGDEQSIEQSLSTFSSHMTNIARIMQAVTDRSLVLFDELGAGTDPNEGAALAMAILERLRISQVRTVATTHYSELKAYSLTTEGIENASVEFDAKTLAPTYKLAVGIPGMSNALLISERLGLEKRLVERARELMSGERVRFESVLEKAEQHRRQAEEENERANQLRRETERIKSETAQMQAELEQQRQQILEKAKKEAAKLLQQADQKAQEYIDELKQMKEGCNDEALIKMQTKRKAMREELAQANAQKLGSERKVGEPAPAEVRVGQTVFVHSLSQNAVVQSVPNAKGEIKVQAGILQMNVPLSGVSLVQENEKSNKKSTRSAVIRAASSVPLSIDVRGMMVEEANLYVDRYLDEVSLAHYNEVTIIHGKGTGALRAGIMQFLKGHPRVASFRAGRYGEGELGVTVVTMK
ncbi:MAG: endonuclease MutS2 [Clostridiales bacterium]|nr:endonuclease MutS2 [Clostridiales bacterium]